MELPLQRHTRGGFIFLVFFYIKVWTQYKVCALEKDLGYSLGSGGGSLLGLWFLSNLKDHIAKYQFSSRQCGGRDQGT